ncbi:hypothetical protein ACIP46_00400 [Streptomyces lavendulae]|uniref:hypothetical protein n=1 Tax=Streptomyces lavendulae TaxID=1914 RepID=UPI0037F39860
MANESDTTPIHNVYAQRFAADLETNRKEQELVSVQITELEVRLAQLKSDENWLLGIQGTLPSEAEKERAAAAPATAPADDTRDAPAAPVTPAASATGPASGGVPKPRQARKATGTASRARTAAPAKKASSSAAPAGTKADVKAESKAESKAGAKTSPKAVTKARATTRKSAAPKPPVAATVSEPKADKAGRTGRAAEPPLRELVLALLVGAAEPRLVSEVASALIEAHPGRPTSTQVVRNALEALAKKGSIEKEHKQGSVMYTAPRPAAPEPAPAPAAEPVAEPVAAPETVAAEV